MPNDKITVVLCGGGTLGPVTPLLAVARALRELSPGVDILWIGTDVGPESRLVTEAGIPFLTVNSGKLRRYFSWRNFTDPFRVVRGFFEALRLLRRARPAAVVGAGGFVAVPVVWAAWLMRIPVHVHQQDLRPGLANRLSSPFAASMSVAFEASLADFKRYKPVWTGNPVRAEIFNGSRDEAQRLFGLDLEGSGPPTVLVLGGGTGASGLNDLVRASLPALTAEAQLLHVAGIGKTEAVAGAPRYHQVEFLSSEMKHAYAAADLVVTRAGMGALTEIAALGLPAIIVPMPGSHQEDNARAFGDRGAGLLLVERTTFSKQFADAALGLLKDTARLDAMRRAMRGMNRPDADKRVAELVLKAAQGNG